MVATPLRREATPPPRSRRLCSPHPSSGHTGCAAPSAASFEREQPLWLFDALQRVLAAVVERHTGRGACESAYGVRYQPLARRGGARDPRRDVDSAAVDVVPLAD